MSGVRQDCLVPDVDWLKEEGILTCLGLEGEVDSEPALHGYSPTGLRKPEDFRLANGGFS